jgi:hypothetical protein
MVHNENKKGFQFTSFLSLCSLSFSCQKEKLISNKKGVSLTRLTFYHGFYCLSKCHSTKYTFCHIQSCKKIFFQFRRISLSIRLAHSYCRTSPQQDPFIIFILFYYYPSTYISEVECDLEVLDEVV